jgi:hypothetical protein
MNSNDNLSKVPVYISLTSIFNRQNILERTLQSIIKQTRLPDKIFLYLSEEPYILDDGFKYRKITDSNLLELINANTIIDIKWEKNTGPYRKLLPLLREKWNEDCIIITVDDDLIMDKNSIKNLITDYNEHKCVISYRGFTPIFDKIDNFDYCKRDKLKSLSLYNFSTNGAGTLWKPCFFHKTKELIFNNETYLDVCDRQDDIFLYLVRVLNEVSCYIGTNKFGALDTRSKGLYVYFNSKNNNNTIVFKNAIKKLKNLNYKF